MGGYYLHKMKRFFEFKGKKFSVEPSSRKDKQLVATFKGGKKIHFGDPKMKEYPSTERGDRYCSRSFGISDDSKVSANLLSRKILWKCKGKESKESFAEAEIKRIKKEEFYN